MELNAYDAIDLRKDNIVNTLTDILAIHVMSEGLTYDSAKWGQFTQDRKEIRLSISEHLGMRQCYYHFAIRDEATRKDKRYLSYYISFKDLISLYLQAYQESGLVDEDELAITLAYAWEQITEAQPCSK